jgi:metal-responsive CopG/Arc/MetJ family transcriptional regulator
MTLRTTIYLDDTVVKQIRRFVPKRGLSQLVNEMLRQKVAELEQAEIETQMRAGYLASRKDRDELNADWQNIDGEGWPA